MRNEKTTIQDGWVPEPELTERPPRRFVESEYPDLNKPSILVYAGIGGGILLIGMIMLMIGLATGRVFLTIPGVIMALGGAVMIVLYPTKLKSHNDRAENLVTNGVPVMARILASDNLTGDSVYGRSVKYQVTLPGGEMAHRSVNADDRALPKRIPGDTTALMDMKTGDVELYCALPFRATTRDAQSMAATPASSAVHVPSGPVPSAGLPVSAVTAASNGISSPPDTARVAPLPPVPPPPSGGGMGTLGPVMMPVRPATTQPTTPAEAPATDPGTDEKKPEPNPRTGTSGLPWE